MKFVNLLTLTLLFSVTSPHANECDSDYSIHNQTVLELSQSGNSELASAQRDCLAVELGHLKPGDSFCPTFRDFQSEFLSLPEGVQIKKGKRCMEKLLSERES